MQLTKIQKLTGTLIVQTGIRIGAGSDTMQIGGVDNPVIKHPHTGEPYIPGSSIKGKMRSLLEWRSGYVNSGALTFKDYAKSQNAEVKNILQLFGIGGGDQLTDEQAQEIGFTRLSFADCGLDTNWKKTVEENDWPLFEVKSETAIDRIKGTAKNGSLRQTERVPAGAQFEFSLSIKCLDGEEWLPVVLQGLKLIELDSLGGSGSRGYGKVKFADLKLDGVDCSEQFNQTQPFDLPLAASK